MSNRILGIEISRNTTKIVEIGYARRVKLFNFAVIENESAEPERRAEQIQHTLRQRGFEARTGIVAIGGAGIEHRLLTLPTLSDREMHFVMAREAKKLNAGESVWAYDQLKSKEELGVRKEQILLVSTERKTVTDVQDFLASTTIKVQQITTIPEAILNLMRQSGIMKKDAVKLVVHFSGARAHVLFVEDGSLMLSRDFPVEYESVSHEEQVHRLVTEIKRSMLFFRQNYPQTQLHEILYSGDSDIIGTLSTTSKDEFKVEASVMRFDDMLDPSGFRGDWNEFRFHIPAMAAAIGAAWRKVPGSGINLAPGKKAVHRTVTDRAEAFARVAAVVAIVLALLTGAYYYLQVSGINGSLAAVRQREIEVRPSVNQADVFQQQRALATTRQAFLKRIEPATNWLEAFRGLSFVVPESAVFESVQIAGEPNPVMTVRGQMVAPTAAQANADFHAFFKRLPGLPLFSAVTMSQPLTVANEAGVLTVSGSPSPRSRVSFEVRCELTSNN